MFGGTFAPAGWAFCNGALLSIAENEVLFNLIGTTFGGDGQETFALPDLQGRAPMHRGPNFTVGQTGGVEQVTLSVNQIPAHTHPFNATTALATAPTPGNNTLAQSGTMQWYTQDNPNQPLDPQTLAQDGGGQPHDNMHPYLVVSYIISLYGIYPQPS
jgi:microcystin-dependent protein